MATQVQFRRGTTTDISTFIGADGEVVVDTTKKTCVVHDGIQVAGYPLLREDGSNSALNAGNLSSCALKFINDPNTGIISPGADQIALVTGGASRLSIDSSGSVTIPGNLLVSGSLTGALTLDDGSAAVPALRFTNDPDTGIYLSGTNEVAISTGGTQRLTTTTTAVTSTLPVIHPLGAAATPSLTFAGDTNTGIYSSGSDQVAISTGGTQRLTTTTTEVTSTLPVIHPLGAAATPSLTFAGDTNTGIYSPGADQVAISTNGTGRLFINSSGSVGVGTSSPDGKLTVAIGTNDYTAPASTFNVLGPDTTGLYVGTHFDGSGAGCDLVSRGYSSGMGDFRFIAANGSYASPVTRMVIDGTGRVGIGTTGPNGLLDVRSATTWIGDGTTDAFLQFNQSATAADRWHIGTGSFSSNALIFYKGTYGTGSETARIDSSGRLGLGTSPAVTLDVANVHGINNSITRPFRIRNYGQVSATGYGVGMSFFYPNGTTSDLGFEAAAIDSSYTSGGNFGNLIFSTNNNTGVAERMRISSAGTTTLTSAASTAPFIANIGASEAARIDSSGRLLVGTSSGSGTNLLQIQGSTAASTGIGGIALRRGVAPSGMGEGSIMGYLDFGPNDGGIGCQIVGVADETQGTNDYPGRLVFSTTADGASSPTERMRITSDAYVRLASGTGGIQFNADTAAANALDDYEEGTWTPTPLFGGASVGITYTTSPVGYYTKIGRLVHVQFGFRLSNKGSSTGDFSVAGLPFTVGGTGSFLHPTGSVNAHYLVATGIIVGSLGDGTIVRYRKLNDSTADTPLTDADFTNNVGFYQSLVYFV